MELAPPNSGEPEPQFARVTKRLHDDNGITIWKVSDKPILNTRMYEVEYADGNNSALSANLSAENMFAEIYEEVNRHVLMDEKIDHRFNETAVNNQDAFVNTSSGTKRRRQMNQGVSLCIKLLVGNTTCGALKDTKEAYPVQITE